MKRKRKPYVQVYAGLDGDWFWRLVAANGRTVADGSEGYRRPSSALKAAFRCKQIMVGARVVLTAHRKHVAPFALPSTR